jgi:hypothetical protein
VRDGQHGAVEELRSDRCLDQIVSFQIDRRCCFIQNENFGFAKKSASQTNKLSLADTEK